MIILEGPDGGGKSTLAEAIKRRYPSADVVHHGPYEGDRVLFEHYLATLLRPAPAHDHPLVLDRCWLSEPIYGAAVRHGENRVGRIHRRMLERVALARDPVVVNCLPSWQTVFDTWASRKDAEYVEAPAHLQDVYHDYGTLAEQTELPVLRYNRDDHVEEETLTRVVQGLALRNNAPCYEGVLGNRTNPKLLIVGDRSNGHHDLPFVKRAGCSPWLTQVVDAAGAPEAKLAWVNARTPDGAFKDPDALPPEVLDCDVVALGRVAQAWCENAGLSYRGVPHPQHWKRFMGTRTYPLYDLLMEYNWNE